MVRHVQYNNYDFEVLEAFDSIPDSKYEYVQCAFYKKDLHLKLYVRKDLKLYNHKVMRCEHNNINGFVAVKEIQKHPVSDRVIHVDFFILHDDFSNVRIKLPLKFENMDKSPGIKLGGFLNITSRNLEVRVNSAKDLVPWISVDMTGLKQEESIRVANMAFGSGLTPIRKDLTVATLMPSKGGE